MQHSLCAFLFVLSCLIWVSCDKKNAPAPIGPQNETEDRPASNTQPVVSTDFLNTLTFPHEKIEASSVKDAIPSLQDPLFVPANSPDAAYLSDEDLVLGVHLNGISRAYPLRILWHHEIVNDIFGGQEIAVTYSPLTGSGLVFDGSTTSQGERLRLGVSGRLFNNNLIMYDRGDEQIQYPQMTHMAISGFRTGWFLLPLPVIETTWGFWRKFRPATGVISSTTPGLFPLSRYNQYPYGTYRTLQSRSQFPLCPPTDENPIGRLYPPKTRVFGIRFLHQARAYPFPELGEKAILNNTVSGEDVLVVWYGPAQLAMAFNRRLGGQTLTFTSTTASDRVQPFYLKDDQTGSTWTLEGRAIAGPLKDHVLLQIPGHIAYWFAWSSFWQNTEIYTAP